MKLLDEMGTHICSCACLNFVEFQFSKILFPFPNSVPHPEGYGQFNSNPHSSTEKEEILGLFLKSYDFQTFRA